MPFQTKTAIKIDSIQAPTWFVKFNINPLSCFHLHLRYQTESQALEKFSVEVAASQKRAGTQVHNPACSSKLDRARMDQRKPCALFAASMAWWRLMNAALRKSCGGMNNRMWSPGASFQLPCQNLKSKRSPARVALHVILWRLPTYVVQETRAVLDSDAQHLRRLVLVLRRQLYDADLELSLKQHGPWQTEARFVWGGLWVAACHEWHSNY